MFKIKNPKWIISFEFRPRLWSRMTLESLIGFSSFRSYISRPSSNSEMIRKLASAYLYAQLNDVYAVFYIYISSIISFYSIFNVTTVSSKCLQNRKCFTKS